MAVVQTPPNIWEEIAEFLASSPDREAMLTYRPSAAVQGRARELLEKQQSQTLSPAEEGELVQFQNAELLMRLVKARVRLQDAE